MIEAIVFDLGGVVCEFHPERRLARLSEASPLATDEIQRLVWDSGFDHRCDTGQLQAVEIHEAMTRLLKLHCTYDELREAWASAFIPNLTMLDFVRNARKRFRVALLTDNNPLLHESLHFELADVGQSFDEVYFSYQFGFTKPDQRIFDRVSTSLNVPPANIAFLDDSFSNVGAAALFGWQARVFTSRESLGTWPEAIP